MSLNLKAALQADGKTGSAGQSMKNDLTGATTGKRLSDWRISGVSFTGEPIPDLLGGYSSGHVFNIVATITRGAEAYRIQRNLSSAWTVYTLGGGSVSVTSFGTGGSPTGATHSLNIQVTGARTGTPTDFAEGVQDTSGAEGAAWPMTQFYIEISGGGGVGQTELELVLEYNPDSAAFNPVLKNLDGVGEGWKFMMDRDTYSTSDFDIEWHSSSAFDHTSLITTGSSIGDFYLSDYYPSSTSGLFPGEEMTMWVQYRLKGSSGAWTKYDGAGVDGAVFFKDDRPAV